MENNQRNSKKRLNSLILLVAFTAVMLIVSTYAWFSAQKNVTIKGLEGNVNVAEGLMISLDAKNWSQEIDWTAPILDTGKTLAEPYAAGDGTTYTYAAGKNNIPTEMIPVSATGTEDLVVSGTSGSGNADMSFYLGTNINSTELYGISKTYNHTSEAVTGSADVKYPGFYAVDLYLQNSSKIDTASGDVQGTTKETLQLNTNSLLKLLSAGSQSAYTTGLQNTTRVALAMYDTTGLENTDDVKDKTSSIYVTADQNQILEAYKNAKISDIAIWEPNASTHTEYVVTNNNKLKLDDTVGGLYITAEADGTGIHKFIETEVLPTYALTKDSLTAVQELTNYDSNDEENTAKYKGIKNIYDWKTTTGTGMARQIALQTDTEGDYTTATDGVRNLVSVKSSGAAIYELGNESGAVNFQMLKNSIIKLRMYLWLEGQDPDTINQASHGGGVHLDLGLVKGGTPGTLAGD